VNSAADGDLIAWAKARVVPVQSCVTASLRPDHLLSEASWEQLAALVIVLAEAADPVKLRAVVSARDITVAPGTDRWSVLKMVYAERRRLERHGQPIPAAIEAGYLEYLSEGRKRRLRARAEQDGEVGRAA
jgi:hypothetical protein